MSCSRLNHVIQRTTNNIRYRAIHIGNHGSRPLSPTSSQPLVPYFLPMTAISRVQSNLFHTSRISFQQGNVGNPPSPGNAGNPPHVDFPFEEDLQRTHSEWKEEQQNTQKQTGNEGPAYMLKEEAEKQIKIVQEEAQKLKEQLGEMKNNLIRAIDEAENARKIAKNDVENAQKYGISKFAKGLLDVADNLGRCLAEVSRIKIEDSPGLNVLVEGMQMTEKELLKVFKNNGLQKLDPMDKPFDPNSMSALLEIENPSKPPGTVVYVLKNGYSLNDRVLRPSEVGIGKQTEPEAPPQ